MSKFKVGDKVRFIARNQSSLMNSQLELGEVYEVDEINANGIQDLIGLRGKDNYNWVNNFELVESNESELERLVRVANEGDEAIRILKEKYPNDVIDNEGDPITQYGNTFTFSIKQKPKFEPFTVGSGWQVKLEGDTVSVGCKTYKAISLLVSLKDVAKSGSGPNYEFRATRTGVVDGSGNAISWDDADKIISALEKAGF